MRNEDLKAYGHSKKGITLVELIVAMTLTSIFAVLCVMLINPIERTYRGTLKLARAQLLADTLIDSIRKECDDVRHDETSDVWITDLSGNDDGQLFSDGPANKASFGNTLVFRRNNNYTEAIYAGVGISDANYTAVTGNVLTPENTAHSIDALKIAGSENMKAGYVHFGYYQAKEDDRGIFPIESYDYTNPVMAKTYGDFNVELKFYDLTLRDSKYPAYVMCKLTIMEKGKEVYSRSAVLCFAANGSGKGSGSHHPVNPTVRDIEVNVVWKDNGASDKRPASGLAFTLTNSSDSVLGTHSLADVRTDDTQRFVFKNINTANGWKLSIAPDIISAEYERTILKTANGFLVTYTRVNEVMLIPGPDFNNYVKNIGITSFVFAKKDDEHLAYVGSTKPKNVSIDKNGNITNDYELYIVSGTDGSKTAYVLSDTGTFNGNPIMGTMFMNCKDVTQFTGLNSINTSQTTDMHRLFYNCRNVTMGETGNLTLTWNTDKVETMDGMFRNFACGSDYDQDVTINISTFSFQSCKEYHIEANANNNIIGINKMFNCDGKEGASRIVKIVFKEGYKDARQLDMLQNVFTGCSKLQTIENFDNFNCSGVTQFLNNFTNCSSLTELDMSHWNLSKVKNLGAYTRINSENKTENVNSMFSGLTGLEKINLNFADFSSATNLKYVFSGFANLKTVYMTGFKTNTNEEWTMEGYFYNCKKLETVTMPNVVNSKCTSTKSLFYDCDSLTEMNMSTWNTSGVTDMSSMFFSSGVTEVEFPSSNTSFQNVTTIASMFQNCTDLTTITNFILNTDSETTAEATLVSCPALTNANSLFGGCVGLKNIKFKLSAPGLVKISSLFSNCSNLITADLSGTDFHSLTNVENMFNTCNSLTSVKMNSVDMSAVTGKYVNDKGENKDCVFFNSCNALTYLEMKSINLNGVSNLACFVRNSIQHFDMSEASVTGITSLEKLFSGKTNLTYVDVSNVTWGAYSSAFQMFYGCENLQTIKLKGFVAPSNCKEMFKNCYYSKNLNLDGMDTTAVQYMDSMFYNCYSLEGFDSNAWTGWTTSNVKSMANMFMNCVYNSKANVPEGKYTINISNFDFSNVESFKEMFNCDDKNGKDLASTIILPTGENAIDSAATVTTNRMFRNRKNLTNIVNLEHFYIENIHTDAGSTFATIGVTTLNISKLDLNKITDNAQWMFNDCLKLTTIYVNPELANNNTFATRFKDTIMFNGESTNLVGPNGTRWKNSDDYKKGKRAVIDKDGSSGYFWPAPATPPEDPNP